MKPLINNVTTNFMRDAVGALDDIVSLQGRGFAIYQLIVENKPCIFLIDNP